MSKSNRTKKTASRDWHRADIKAALEKAGWSLRQLSMAHGYAAPNTLSIPLARPWPKGEKIIANAIGVHPAEIWPSRYQDKYIAGKRKSDSPILETGGALCA